MTAFNQLWFYLTSIAILFFFLDSLKPWWPGVEPFMLLLSLLFLADGLGRFAPPEETS